MGGMALAGLVPGLAGLSQSLAGNMPWAPQPGGAAGITRLGSGGAGGEVGMGPPLAGNGSGFFPPLARRFPEMLGSRNSRVWPGSGWLPRAESGCHHL